MYMEVLLRVRVTVASPAQLHCGEAFQVGMGKNKADVKARKMNYRRQLDVRHAAGYVTDLIAG